MRSVQWVVIVAVLTAATLGTQTARLANAACDSKCRDRQNFYNCFVGDGLPGDGKYIRYTRKVCDNCKRANALCVVNAYDNIGLPCTAEGLVRRNLYDNGLASCNCAPGIFTVEAEEEVIDIPTSNPAVTREHCTNPTPTPLPGD
ncbi:MAG: hypothetical protein MUF18_21920 [Fimbriiglobus sp.]|jgi:hypothetical protein|nr:hypothetical protein [Fimbriiglobus sp.]